MPLRRREPGPHEPPLDVLGSTLALLRASLDATSEGILLLDPSGRVVTFNEHFLELWGIPRELAEAGDADRVFGLMLDRLHDEPAFVRVLAEAAERPESHVSTWVDLQDERHLEVTSYVREVGAARYRIWVFRDATLEVRAEQVLRRSAEQERDVVDRARRLREMETAFLTAVSHELRTPLGSIIGFARTVRESGDRIDAAVRDDMLERIERNARRLERLLADLIDVDRLVRGTLQAYRTRTDVAALIRRVIEENPSIPTERIRIEAGEVVAMVDASKVERLVDNLVANALRYGPPDTPIRLTLTRDEEGVKITVEDEGPGVPAPFREAIFEPFRQGPGVSEHAPGLGVGLSLVAGVAKLHGGRAWVEDRHPTGSSFRVVLPETSRAADESRAGAES